MESPEESENSWPTRITSLNWEMVNEVMQKARTMNEKERESMLDELFGDAPALRAELATWIRRSEKSQMDTDHLLNKLLGQPPAAVEGAHAYPPGYPVLHYEIIEKIGGGGMGVIYKAQDLRLKRIAALKFLPAYLYQDDDSRERFLQEARATSALDHPNICTVYEINDLPDGSSFIAMAYYEGITLKELIDKGPITVEKAIDVAIQVGAGLMQAHKHGIIHRDIKPANIILTEQDLVKILDFGIAKSPGLDLTKTGATLGTIAYMAPEQANGETVDHRADLWALGVVLYEMLTGQRPFEGDHAAVVLYNIVHREPKPVTGLRAGIPFQLAHIVQKLLFKSPAQRYQNVEHVISDLEAIKHRKAARVSAEEAMFSRETPGPNHGDEAVAGLWDEGAIKILFVDDEPEYELLIRTLFRRKAKTHNWIMEFASSGKEALERLAKNPDIALVLTDLKMPEMDGLTLLDRMHDLNIPLKSIVVSAYSDLPNIRAAMNRGAFDFVVKPIDADDMEATILKSSQEWFKERKAARYERQLVALQKELDVARQIQEAIQPVDFDANSTLDLYAFSSSTHEINGTFYDHYWVDDHRVGFLVGDIGGKGVSAAVFMVMIQMYFKSVALQGHLPGRCMTLVNRLLVPEGFPELSVSAFYGLYNTATGSVQYCNAGLPPPYILYATGAANPLQGAPEVPVWSEHGHEFRTHHAVLHSEESLIVFTRGVITARSPDGTLFSLERLAQTLHASRASSSAELIRTIIRTLLGFTENGTQEMDLTLLALQNKAALAAD